MKATIMLLVLLMAVPCFGRSKKSQAKIDARHAQAAAANQAASANLLNAQADATRQRSQDRHSSNVQLQQYNQQTIIQRQHQNAIRNGQQQRKAKAANSRKYTGF